MDRLFAGLEPSFLHAYHTTGVLDLTTLKLANVTALIPGDNPEIDWDNILYIRNRRPEGRTAETIVWTRSQGFFRVQLSPQKVVDLRATTGVVCWLDMRAYRNLIKKKYREDLLELTVPYVLGNVRLVPVGSRQNNHYSWINCRYIDCINPTSHDRRTRVNLEDGPAVIIRERATSLKKKAKSTTYIYDNQQAHLQLIHDQHGHDYDGRDLYGYARHQERSRDLQAVHVGHDMLMATELRAFFGYHEQVSDEQLLKLVEQVRRGEHLPRLDA